MFDKNTEEFYERLKVELDLGPILACLVFVLNSIVPTEENDNKSRTTNGFKTFQTAAIRYNHAIDKSH
jgi:hypothetical protein